MKTKALLIIVSVAIATLFALAQTKTFPTVKELMTPEEFRASGLLKLSDREVAALDTWVQRHSLRVAQAVAPLGGATATQLWEKGELIPVVLVKPGIGGFEPIEGSAIGNRWSKDKVKPVVLLKPELGGFVPTEGTSIGNRWTKDEVTAVVVVEPVAGGFTPYGSSRSGAAASDFTDSRKPAEPAVIESTVDGEFKGFDGKTTVKLSNGDVWRQTEYFYEFDYAYMPKVLLVRRGGGYVMKVEGISKTVGVERLR
jgi:hypothetical protein